MNRILFCCTVVGVGVTSSGSYDRRNSSVDAFTVRPPQQHLLPVVRTTCPTGGIQQVLSSLSHRRMSRLNFDSNSNSNKDDTGCNNRWETYPINELHTKLRDATTQQDYTSAGQISDELLRRLYSSFTANNNNNMNSMNNTTAVASIAWDRSTTEERRMLRKSLLTWKGLGSVSWLIDRLDTFNYTFPTTIQINAFSAVNAILSHYQDGSNNNVLNSAMTSTTLEERVKNRNVFIDYDQINNDDIDAIDMKTQRNDIPKDLGVVISGATGSGKSLAYIVPMLSILSESLFVRQRLRISDEESIGDTAGDLADRINVVTAPRLITSSTSSSSSTTNVKRGGTIATGAAIATLGRSGTDVKAPLALIVVPTRELGSQTAYLLYQLVGGASQTIAQAQKYSGPKGVRIGCVLDDDDAQFGLKLQTDIAITTPQYLSKLLQDGDIIPSKLRVIAYDEADLALEQTSAIDLNLLFNDDTSIERMFTRLSFLVGASVTESLGNLAVSSRILPAGQSYIATAINFAPLTSITTTPVTEATTEQIVGAKPKSASLQDLDVCMYPGLTHERVIVKKGESSLLALTRLIRQELQNYESALATDSTIQRPRVVVFFPDEVQAKEAIAPLRDALWGDHKLCVLLPKTGFSPMTIMDQFKRNETSVMLATPNSVRGLDFPALTHCYTLYLPVDDPREYIHLAGRVGRVGHRTKGRVISILNEQDAKQMDDLAQQLNFQFTDVSTPTAESLLARTDDGTIDEDAIDYEKLRRAFEDTISLVDPVEEPTFDPTAIRNVSDNSFDDEDEEDDEDGDEDENDNVIESEFQ